MNTLMSGGGTRLMQVWIHNNYFPKKETQNDILGIVFHFLRYRRKTNIFVQESDYREKKTVIQKPF